MCLPRRTPLAGEIAKRGLALFPYLRANLHIRSRWWRLYAALGVLRACIEFRPNIIYLNQSGAYRLVLPSAILFRLGIVAHVRIFEDASYLAERKPAPTRLRSLIAISTAIEREIRSFPQLSTIPVHTIYDSYNPTGRSATSQISPYRIACVGRLVPIKGQDILVHALIEARKVYRDVECLMIGIGEEAFTQAIKEIASARDIDVQWVGFSNDVMPLLQSCAVLVCPSWREPLGRIIFEAWDAGAIPVAFRGSGGAAEILIDSNAGILYDAQDPRTLAGAIVDALALGSCDRARMLDNGRSWLAKNCDPLHYGNSILKVLSGGLRERC